MDDGEGTGDKLGRDWASRMSEITEREAADLSQLAFDRSKCAPSGWGDDFVSAFIGRGHQNTWATFVRCKAEYNLLLDIHHVFRKAIDHLTNTREVVEAVFLPRSHAAYLGGAGFAMSGQLREAYLVLRGGLEDALYAYFIFIDSEAKRAWLEGDKQVRRNKFHMGSILQKLEAREGRFGSGVRDLYGLLIELGAHPNPSAVFPNMQIKQTEEFIQFDSLYLNIAPSPLKAALKTSACVGAWVLQVFQRVFETRFELIGIVEDVNRVKEGLSVLNAMQQ
ncbi:MAG: hypothetical protein Q8R91_06780 [Candidatus Omnitrophota bacterium]|nr:hypothetical protein [Candidatus Omnitrophota bacterium]